MTMPIQPGRTIEIPPAEPPFLTRMISNAFFPEIVTDELTQQKVRREDPIVWLVSKPHPLVKGMNVFRMFVSRGGVEIYSLSDDGKKGIRDLIPMSQIRLIGEEMPLDVFVDEFALSEAGDGDPDPDDAPDPDDEPPEEQPSPNGQVASS